MEPIGNASNSGDRNDKKTVASSATTKLNEKSSASSAIVMKPEGKSTASSAIMLRPNGKSAVPSSIPMKPRTANTVASSAAAKPNGKSTASSVILMKPNCNSDVSSANPMNQKAATALSSAHGDQVMLFRDVSLGPHESELRFRLIHFWEARNPNTKTLIGQEMLLIDEEGTVIQGFVPSGRVGTYKLTAGSVYKLSKFFGSRNKVQFRVSDHIATVSFSWNSVLSVIENPPVPIHEDRFRFHNYEEFKANCDCKGDLYDYVGHMKLVNGQTITDHIVLDEVEISEKRHLCVHVQTHDGPVMKLYLWDQAAADFCQKFRTYASSPRVLLVTTVNPKHLGAMEKERVELEIGYPTDVKHLAHIGLEGSSSSGPGWMSEFRVGAEALSPRASSFSNARPSSSFLTSSSTDFDQGSSGRTIFDTPRDITPVTPINLPRNKDKKSRRKKSASFKKKKKKSASSSSSPKSSRSSILSKSSYTSTVSRLI